MAEVFQRAAENSALILGLAISAYTIYSVLESRITRRRQRILLFQYLVMQTSGFTRLAGALERRTGQVMDKYNVTGIGKDYPAPAKEQDSLPESAQEDIQWLVNRAEQVLDFQFTLDDEKVGGLLDQVQFRALSDFFDQYRRYVDVLETRTIDLKMFPRKEGVLVRFNGVQGGNIQYVRQELQKLVALRKSG